MISETRIADAIFRLHKHLQKMHWTGEAITGPDPGIRFNARIGRFVKGYLNFLPWRDNLIYAQAQKYWIVANWFMHDLEFTGASENREFAINCTDFLCRIQRPQGYWEYPNPEWRGRIATVEGNYASIGLLETFNRTQDVKLLQGAKKWVDYAIEHIGFQEDGEFLAINYFGNYGTAMVPNNSASAVRVFAMLAKAAHDDRYLEKCRPMVRWLNHVQLASGELPYYVRPPQEEGKADRIHFLCHQYNAFEFLNLADYYDISGDREILPVLQKLAKYLAIGITATGACRYTCGKEFPEVAYYTTALGAALRRATCMDFGNYSTLADKAYSRLLSQQKRDGNFAFYSRKNYGFLSDKRSYARYLAMILYHLLLELALIRNQSILILENQ